MDQRSDNEMHFMALRVREQCPKTDRLPIFSFAREGSPAQGYGRRLNDSRHALRLRVASALPAVTSAIFADSAPLPKRAKGASGTGVSRYPINLASVKFGGIKWMVGQHGEIQKWN